MGGYGAGKTQKFILNIIIRTTQHCLQLRHLQIMLTFTLFLNQINASVGKSIAHLNPMVENRFSGSWSFIASDPYTFERLDPYQNRPSPQHWCIFIMRKKLTDTLYRMLRRFRIYERR
jgi:hypothetical protein